MKQKKKILPLLIVSVILLTNTLYVNKELKAVNEIPVYIDGSRIHFEDATPHIINERTMVPLYSISKSLDAHLNWEPIAKKVTLFLHDRYVLLYVDNPVMVYGDFSTDANGEVIYRSTNVYTLESPPIIVDERTLVPLSAITYGLGANSTWNNDNRSVYITSAPKPVPSPTPIPTPTPSPTISPNLFDDTNTFKTITGKRAQSMHDSNDRFILFYYDSSNKLSQQYMPIVKAVATKNRFQIYGVDSHGADYDFRNSDLKFIWDYVRPNDTHEPLIFFVYGTDDVHVNKKAINENTLNNQFDDFIYYIDSNVVSPTNPPSPTLPPTATPRPTSTPAPDFGEMLTEINRSRSERMFSNGDKFIFVSYFEGDTDSDNLMNVVKLASFNAKKEVYISNAFGIDENVFWWAHMGNGYKYYPIVYFVDNGSFTTLVQPRDALALENRIISFMQ
jgi:hypothetical protein